MKTVLGFATFLIAAAVGAAPVDFGSAAMTGAEKIAAPDHAWVFPVAKGKPGVQLKSLPDWGSTGFTAEVRCLPETTDCGYPILVRGSFGFPKFFGTRDYDAYLIGSAPGNAAGRVYTPLEPGKYHNYAMTGTPENNISYRDGKSMRVNKAPGVPKYDPAAPMYVGNSIGWGKNFVGKVVFIRIYNRALSAAEIAENHRLLEAGQPLPKQDGLIFEVDRRVAGDFWKFNGGTVKLAELAPPAADSLELSFSVKPEALADATLLDWGKNLVLKLHADGSITGTFAGARIAAPKALSVGKESRLSVAWNGETVILAVNNQAVGVPAKASGRLTAAPLLLGGGFHGVIGQFDIKKNEFLPADFGKTVTEKLDNRDRDTVAYPRSRHIAGKPEKDKPQLDFEDLTGWTVTYTKGAVEPIISRSKEEPLWGDYVLRTEFRKGKFGLPGGKVVLAPPQPIKITHDFDAINIWRFATDYQRPRPALLYSIQYRDATGKLQSTGNLGGFLETGWGVHHVPLKTTVKAPAELVSLTFSGFNEARRVSYFDSLRFYTVSRAALPDATVPSWQELGVPTRAETILPTPTEPGKVKLQAVGKNVWRFTSVNASGKTLIFDIRPASGTLSDITATYAGKTFKPLANGGFHWALDNLYPVKATAMLPPHSPQVQPRFKGGKMHGDDLTLNWEYTIGQRKITASWQLTVRDNSLIADLRTDGGDVAEFQFGGVSGISGKVIEVPYLTLGGWIHKSFSPGIFAADGVYVSSFVDWYNSDASGLFGESSARIGGRFELDLVTADHRWIEDKNAPDPTNVIRDYSVINGGSYYWPKTDGRRNPARERIFVTVSDRFDAVLPNIPNPRHANLANTVNDVWATRMWYSKLPVANYFERELAMWQLCRAYGMEKLNVRLHGNINRMYYPRRDGGPTTFIKDFAEPGIGGNAKLAEFCKSLKKLGYRIGLYTDHMLFSQLSYEAWDEDKLNLDSNSNWIYSSGMDKQTKISRMVALQKEYNGYMREMFGPTCAYLDQITCPPCWRYTDYDARAPEAGKFSAAFRVFVASLRQEERDFGPVLSEGKTQMYFAGICDSYAQPQRLEMNLVPNFNLRKLHELSNDCGYELGLLNWKGSGIKPEIGNYRTLAYEYIYGSTGHIYGPYHGEPYDKALPDYMIRSYFMIQPFQKFYALTPVREILYNVNGTLQGIEAAIAAGALGENQVKLIYANGAEVAANLNKTRNFRVKLHDRDYLLPPDGFAFVLPGAGMVYSALCDGRRVDFAETSDMLYVDHHGIGRDAGKLNAAEAYILRTSPVELSLIPAPFRVAEVVTVVVPWRMVEVIRLDQVGAILGREVVEVKGGKVKIGVDGKAFQYRIRGK